MKAGSFMFRSFVVLAALSCGSSNDAEVEMPDASHEERDAGAEVGAVVAALEVVSGNMQSAPLGQELPEPLVVRIVDGDDHPVPNQLISFKVTMGDSSVFAGAALSNADGIAQERWVMGRTAGPQQLEARAVDRDTGAALVFGRFEATALAGPEGGGTWSSTGDMHGPRVEHGMVVLDDGRVLVGGGDGSPTSAELYDPQSGTFTTTGDLDVDRLGATWTLLDDGTVLVAGGSGAGQTRAAIYDPAAGTFSRTGDMFSGRSGHSATLLPSGKVLIVGGGGGPELFDPTTGAFALAAVVEGEGLQHPFRFKHTATLLSNGKVLIAGGHDAETASAELYDPALDAFTPTGEMISNRSQHTATPLDDGTVLMVGGNAPGDPVETAELYDPAQGTFTATGSLSVVRAAHAAVTLQGGAVLVIGGRGPINEQWATAELYDPSTGTFAPEGAMATVRSAPCAALLGDGRVLVTGGFGQPGGARASAELWTP